ncbi:transporter [Euzebyella marina]|uniref:transporter n=1 Tax=Euzebyella marina TaxID=1761453 RepID=UPI001969A9C2|nr:transporter [Euzebyella marina]
MINALQNTKLLSTTICVFLVFQMLWAKPDAFKDSNPCIHSYHLEDFFDFCDTCGCGSSGGSMGYGTGLNNYFIGVRYIGQQYRSRDGIFNDSPWITENFNTMQVWGNVPITKRAILNVIVPYQQHNRVLPDQTEQKINGLGDISVLAFYDLLKRTPDSIISITPEHYFQIGAGVKAPTGKYDRANNTGSVNPSFQVGNGSWDYIAAMNYGFTYRNWGISTLLNYTFKTENPKQYQFGNQLNYGINAFKTYYISDLALTPILGIAGEHFEANKEYGAAVPNTKGSVFLGKVSLEASYNRIALGLAGMVPISQQLNNNKVELKHRLSVYVNINL